MNTSNAPASTAAKIALLLSIGNTILLLLAAIRMNAAKIPGLW